MPTYGPPSPSTIPGKLAGLATLPVWLTSSQVCEALQISPCTLWRLTHANKIAHRKWGGVVRYPVSVLEYPAPMDGQAGEVVASGPTNDIAQPKVLNDFPIRQRRQKDMPKRLSKPYSETTIDDIMPPGWRDNKKQQAEDRRAEMRANKARRDEVKRAKAETSTTTAGTSTPILKAVPKVAPMTPATPWENTQPSDIPPRDAA